MKVLMRLALPGFLVVAMALSTYAADNFYDGKKVRVIVSSTPGGGNDTYTRLIARHIEKFIPGNPSMIVQNMPGGGGLRAADYLYRKAPRDGTVMEQINWGVWNYQAVGDPRAKFDFEKMIAIGAAIIETSVVYCRKDRYSSFDELLEKTKSGKLATVGVSGRQSNGFTMGKIIEQVLDRRIYDMVMGYPGARQYSLAIRQGEVDCSGNTWGSFLDQLGDMYKAGDLVVMVQSGTAKGKRNPAIPDVPMVSEIAKTEEGKTIAKAAFSLEHYGRPYAFPPDVPEEQVKIMREAFMKTMQDPKFLEEAERIKRPVDPVSGEELQELWKDAVAPSPAKLEILKIMFGLKS